MGCFSNSKRSPLWVPQQPLVKWVNLLGQCEHWAKRSLAVSAQARRTTPQKTTTGRVSLLGNTEKSRHLYAPFYKWLWSLWQQLQFFPQLLWVCVICLLLKPETKNVETEETQQKDSSHTQMQVIYTL
jgi:hypothetical protein